MKLLYIDLFCGAGGTSTGVENARLDGRQCAKVIACVNHDKNAIASHAANHPDTLHFMEDIRTLELSPLVLHANNYRKLYPEARIVLWASLECTNFSKAKGGLPRDADSRTLAEHLLRYIDKLNPDYIQIENVEEFMSWGDLDDKGKPINKDAGKLFKRWINNIRGCGYHYQHRILNAADYGAYTSRKRYFGMFAKVGLPIVFPQATHSKTPAGFQAPWRQVRDVLDFNDLGKSIFNRKKPLVDSTLKRIYAGLVKFVAGGKEAFILKYNSMQRNGRYNPPGVNEPCPVVATQNRLAITQVEFLSKCYSGHPSSKNISLNAPAGTITTRDHHSFITAYYGNGYNKAICSPVGTLMTRDRFALVTSSFIMNPQYNSVGGSVEKPCFTLIARMDKAPPYLMQACQNGDTMKIEHGDSDTMKEIKRFMRLYGIVDIKMRMLHVQELKQIMGFPKDYVLIGTQAEQKKYIGNAVEVNMARVLCEALCEQLFNIQKDVA